MVKPAGSLSFLWFGELSPATPEELGADASPLSEEELGADASPLSGEELTPSAHTIGLLKLLRNWAAEASLNKRLLLTDKGRAALTEDEGPDVKAIELIKRLAFGRPISGRLARQYAREFLAEIGIKGE